MTSLPSIPAGANAIGSVIVTSAPTTAVTVAALPLPSGAATSALQGGGLPAALALGGGLKIDGSGTALPVSGTVAISGSVATTGTVTANIGTSGALALDATITGGTAKAIVRGAAKGTTVAADATTTVIDLNHQALDVSINGTPAVTISSGSVVVTSAPTTAVTIATLPALTAGAATIGKADQGAGGVSAWKVDGSAVTQPVSGTVALSGTSPVSGTVTANIGTSGSLALDATLTGGTAKSIARSGAKGTSAAADVTSTVIDLNHQALDVVLNGTTSVVVTSAPTTAVTAAALPLPAGASTAALQGAGLPAALGAGGGVKIDGSGTALPTSVASLPLPSGASTSALQGAGLPAALVTGRLDVNIGASAATVPTSSALGSTAANQVTSQTSFTSLVAATLIGQQVIASSRSVVNALLPATPSTSIPTAGQSIKSGATAVGYTVQFINNTGGSIIAMVFDAATTRANGAVPLWVGSTVGTGLPSTLSLGHTVNGLSATTNGIWLQFSSTQTTLTTIASTAITATAITN